VYSDQTMPELYGVLKQSMTYLILLVTRPTVFLIKVFFKEINIRPGDRWILQMFAYRVKGNVLSQLVT
jgi:hypothetical protein